MGQHHDELMEWASLLPVLRAGAADSVVARKAQGPKVYDLDNLGYIDYLGGGGSSVLGFANQFVLDAVKKVLDSGVPVGFHVPQEVDLAETPDPIPPLDRHLVVLPQPGRGHARGAGVGAPEQRQGSDSDPRRWRPARLRRRSRLRKAAASSFERLASWKTDRIVTEIGESAADEPQPWSSSRS